MDMGQHPGVENATVQGDADVHYFLWHKHSDWCVHSITKLKCTGVKVLMAVDMKIIGLR
jgi:hypothetical protein